MIVDVIKKAGSDEASMPPPPPSLVRKVGAVRRPLFLGVTGFDGLQVRIIEIVAAITGKSIQMYEPQVKLAA
jgi:hypothetical protein